MGKIKVTHDCNGIEGLKVIEPAVFGDARGYFMETYNYNDFKEAGIDCQFVQDNQSASKKGVLRGLHFQINHPQDKLVRVVNGEVFDVAVDLREGSETFGKWFGIVLSAENKKQFFVPKNFAHGFIVLSDYAEFCYKVTDFYHPNDEGGILWNDPAVGVEWPMPEGMTQADLILEFTSYMKPVTETIYIPFGQIRNFIEKEIQERSSVRYWIKICIPYTIRQEGKVTKFGILHEIYWIGYLYRYFAFIYEISSVQVYKIVKPKELRGLFLPYAWKLSSGELTLLKGDVRFHDVVFGYVPEKTVLNGISLFAKPGQITYDGIDVKDIRKDDLRRSLSMVIQDTHLFTGTIAHRLSTVRNSNAIMVLEKGGNDNGIFNFRDNKRRT